jgi:hypothetical protein
VLWRAVKHNYHQQPGLLRSILALANELYIAHQHDSYVVPAFRTGTINTDRLVHYTLYQTGNYGIDIVQALIQHIQALVYLIFVVILIHILNLAIIFGTANLFQTKKERILFHPLL